MFFTRFWFFVLGILVLLGVGVSAAVVNHTKKQEENTIKDTLLSDTMLFESTLAYDAHSRLDGLAEATFDRDLKIQLKAANGRSEAEPTDAQWKKCSDVLRAANETLRDNAKGDVAFLLDAKGVAVGFYGPVVPLKRFSLSEMPLIKDALSGQLRDDVWVLGEMPYRMAARPITEGGQYLGVIAVGKRFDDGFFQKVIRPVFRGASVGVFHGGQMVGSWMPPVSGAARSADLASRLPTVLGKKELRDHQFITEALPSGSLATYSLVVGSASHMEVGYVIARPRLPEQSLMEMIGGLSGSDWSKVPWLILAPVALTLVLLGLLFTWLEHNRGMKKFLNAVTEIADKPTERLTPAQFTGSLSKAAEKINEAMSRAAPPLEAKKGAEIDQVLGMVEHQSSQGYFGFKDKNPSSSRSQTGPGTNTTGPSNAGIKNTGNLGASRPNFAGKTPTPTPNKLGPTAPNPRQPSPPPAAMPPKAPPAPPPQPPTKAPTTSHAPAANLRGTLLGANAAPLPAAVAPKDMLKSQVISENNFTDQSLSDLNEGGFTDDEATVLAPRSEAEDMTFRKVYDEYVATKTQCGESLVGLNFEKFAVTLRSRKAQIKEQQQVSDVKFVVYIKEGKAALKASPIR